MGVSSSITPPPPPPPPAPLPTTGCGMVARAAAEVVGGSCMRLDVDEE